MHFIQIEKLPHQVIDAPVTSKVLIMPHLFITDLAVVATCWLARKVAGVTDILRHLKSTKEKPASTHSFPTWSYPTLFHRKKKKKKEIYSTLEVKIKIGFIQ